MPKDIGLSGFLTRVILSLVLVLGTYNPSGRCWVTWALSENGGFTPVVAISGLLLLIGWIVLVKWTFDAIGTLGVILVGALFATVVWWFVDLGMLEADSTSALTWIALIIVAIILAIGTSWSHIKRRMSGQLNVDDLED